MKLSPIQLQNPSALAPSSLGLYRLHRIEASFATGNMEQVKQWEESGVLLSAMQKEIGKRRNYAFTIPREWLICAEKTREMHYRAIGWGEYEKTWNDLRRMASNPPSQMHLDHWLFHASSLPLAPSLIEEGANPHAVVDLNRPTQATAFCKLVENYTQLNSMKGRHRPHDWPKVSEEIAYSQKRILSWLDIPGLSVEHATVLLERITHLRFSFLERNDADFLKALRDGLIEKGARMNGVLLDNIATHVEPARIYSRAYHRSLFVDQESESRHHEKESKRLSDSNRASLVEWCNALTRCEVMECTFKSWSRPDVWLDWFALPGSFLFASHLYANGIGPWADLGSWRNKVFANTDKKQLDIVIDEMLRFEHCLNEKKVGGDLRAWKINVMRSAIEFGLNVVDENQLSKMFEAAQLPVGDVDILDILTHSWLCHSVRFAEKNGDLDAENAYDLNSGLQFLCKSGRLDPLLHHKGVFIVGHEDECSLDDIQSVGISLREWSKNKSLRTMFEALPGQFPRRMAALVPFFCVDENMDERALNIQKACRQSPYVGKNLYLDCKRRAPLSKRNVALWWDIALTGNLMLPPLEAWAEMSRLFEPSLGRYIDSAHWEALIAHQIKAVPYESGPQVLFERIMQQSMHAREGEWDCMVPLLDILQGAGADFSEMETTETSLFTREVSARGQQSKMHKQTPLVENRSRRPRL